MPSRSRAAGPAERDAGQHAAALREPAAEGAGVASVEAAPISDDLTLPIIWASLFDFSASRAC
eukprot:9478724-Pyramimonas_sp.AAC.1